jgi:hypothetical protein
MTVPFSSGYSLDRFDSGQPRLDRSLAEQRSLIGHGALPQLMVRGPARRRASVIAQSKPCRAVSRAP